MQNLSIAEDPVAVTGRLLRIARLRNEHYDEVPDPAAFISGLASGGTRPDLFTFIQPIPDRSPRFPYHLEWDHAAVMHISTFETWWKRQIKDKTRNMIRKAQKNGIEIRNVAFSDELVRGIMRIHDETPVRQGRRFRHYGKPFATVKAEHGTFLDRSDFFGAYYQGDLVGFIKLVHGAGVSHLMQIISMVTHRDKSPTNALIARAVERCADRRVPFLHYGSWSRRSMGDFKRHHAFERMAIPRYYVPLTFAGRTGLRLKLHRSLAERMPESWIDRLADLRGRWNNFRYRYPGSFGAVAQLAERRS
jgi:hypothetical protein